MWSSNEQGLIRDLAPNTYWIQILEKFSYVITAKTSSLHWNAFFFKRIPTPDITQVTKQSYFSQIAKLFDSVEWLASKIIVAKTRWREIVDEYSLKSP